jgi:hypothetical protein
MSWEKSEIMCEFGKLMGPVLVKTAATDKAPKNPHGEDVKTIKEKTKLPEEDIIEIAHPVAIYIAESRGDGGLVENQNEQHAKIMEVINKMPTGALLGAYAKTISALVKMADACDELEEGQLADALTDTASKISGLI